MKPITTKAMTMKATTTMRVNTLYELPEPTAGYSKSQHLFSYWRKHYSVCPQCRPHRLPRRNRARERLTQIRAVRGSGKTLRATARPRIAPKIVADGRPFEPAIMMAGKCISLDEAHWNRTYMQKNWKKQKLYNSMSHKILYTLLFHNLLSIEALCRFRFTKTLFSDAIFFNLPLNPTILSLH